MRKFYNAVTGNPKKIIVIFVAAAVVCIILRNFVGVDYDITDYLPEGTPSTTALDVMGEEFEGGIPNARVMVKDVTIPEALEYKARIAECEGVTDVTWLDDAEDIVTPIETMDQDTVETYYVDGNALFSVTIEEDMEVAAVDAIREVIGEDNAMSGSAVSTAMAITGTESEISVITVVAIFFVLFVLIITTTSWLEPLVVLLGLGVAILINVGTNIIFGEISFVTNAAETVLQLAVSLDYSVFLLHRFEECMEEGEESAEAAALQGSNTVSPDGRAASGRRENARIHARIHTRIHVPEKENARIHAREAMVEALMGSTTSILSSGLTTVIGFLALVFMRFRLGPDLGLALAKGVAISLITTFLFMPAVILQFHGLLQKTRHRSFMPSFRRLGNLICHLMVPFVIVFVVLVVPSYLASNSNDFYYGSAYIYGSDTKLGQDIDEIEGIFGKSDTYVAMVPRGDNATEQELSAALHDVDEVTSILSYVDTVGATIPEAYLGDALLSQLRSDNYSRFVISVSVPAEGEETFALVEQIRGILEDYYPGTWYLAGTGVSTYDLMDTITADTLKVNLIAIAAVFVVLLLTMRSISLPIILVISIETAIWINVGIPYFRGRTVFYISYLIISSIQLGATVDYAILFTERYLENRANMGRRPAIARTASSVVTSLLTSGSALIVVGFLLGYVSSHQIIAQLGQFLGIGTLLSLAIVFFVLPGLLFLLDGAIQHTTLGLHFYKKYGDAAQEAAETGQGEIGKEQ